MQEFQLCYLQENMETGPITKHTGELLVCSSRPPHWVSGSLSAGRSVSWSSRNWFQAAVPMWPREGKALGEASFPSASPPHPLGHLYQENSTRTLGHCTLVFRTEDARIKKQMPYSAASWVRIAPEVSTPLAGHHFRKWLTNTGELALKLLIW